MTTEGASADMRCWVPSEHLHCTVDVKGNAGTQSTDRPRACCCRSRRRGDRSNPTLAGQPPLRCATAMPSPAGRSTETRPPATKAPTWRGYTCILQVRCTGMIQKSIPGQDHRQVLTYHGRSCICRHEGRRVFIQDEQPCYAPPGSASPASRRSWGTAARRRGPCQ